MKRATDSTSQEEAVKRRDAVLHRAIAAHRFVNPYAAPVSSTNGDGDGDGLISPPYSPTTTADARAPTAEFTVTDIADPDAPSSAASKVGAALDDRMAMVPVGRYQGEGKNIADFEQTSPMYPCKFGEQPKVATTTTTTTTTEPTTVDEDVDDDKEGWSENIPSPWSMKGPASGEHTLVISYQAWGPFYRLFTVPTCALHPRDVEFLDYLSSYQVRRAKCSPRTQEEEKIHRRMLKRWSQFYNDWRASPGNLQQYGTESAEQIVIPDNVHIGKIYALDF
jgi:hypothetical protein